MEGENGMRARNQTYNNLQFNSNSFLCDALREDRVCTERSRAGNQNSRTSRYLDIDWIFFFRISCER